MTMGHTAVRQPGVGLVLSAQSPLPRRLAAWSRERFPAAHGLLALALFLAALLHARSFAGRGALYLSPVDVGGFLAVWAFFLTLRVCDEHKDYATDCIHHRDRVLQRGLIGLWHLRAVGGVAVALQAGVSMWYDGGVGAVTLRWLAVVGWSLLMTKEFFAGPWLRRRLVLYAVSHMLVMPLVILWIAQMGVGDSALPPAVYPLAVGAMLSGFVFEIARKTRAPEEERAGVDSYSRVFGARTAPLVPLGLDAAAAALLALAIALAAGRAATAASVAGLALAVALAGRALLEFRREPSPGRARRSQSIVGLAMLLGYAIVAAAIIVERGVRWA